MTQPPMFSTTGSNDFPSFLKCMISGPPKSGKTTMLGTVPGIVILDTEPNANNLQSVSHLNLPFKAINSVDDLRQAQFVLSQESYRNSMAEALGIEKIQAVAIDTLDTLQQIMKRERMKEQRSQQFFRDDWGWLKEEMISILESFLGLPLHVFFVVHTKTKDIGTEKNPKTIVLPGLEGSLAESIAGMVGYSLLSFRKEEVKEDGSGTYTKYWLRAEGDETYEFLGNRAAGRLPDIIEPNFQAIYDAAMAGRPTQATQQVPTPTPVAGFQTTGQTAEAAPPAPPAQQQESTPAPAAGSGPAPTEQQQVAQNVGQPSQAQPAADEPVNANAITFVKKVYDAMQTTFPEEVVRGLNMGQARELVKMWKAVQEDAAEGKGDEPVSVMKQYLTAMGWMPDANTPVAQDKAVEPKPDGTIAEIKAWVGDDLARAQQVHDAEVAKDNPRSSLVEWLFGKGAQPPTEAQPVQTPVETPTSEAPAAPAEAPSEAVTPAPESADASVTEEQAIANAQEGLGAEVVFEGIRPDAKCEVCGEQIDDEDIAQLGKSRYQKILCVKDYLAEGKK